MEETSATEDGYAPEPAADESLSRENPSSSQKITMFSEIDIDLRLEKILSKEGFSTPTVVQSVALPLILKEGRDVLVKAKTGSGKTLLYVLPILSTCLHHVDASLPTVSK